MANTTADFLTGSWMTGDEDAKAKQYLQQSMDAYKGLTAPELQQLKLGGYDWLGDMTPEHVGAQGDVLYNPASAQSADFSAAGPSAMEGVSTDPRLAQQQMASLSALNDIASSGGMTAMDKANLSKMQTEVASADRGRRDAIRQNMGARGMGGSGMDLLAQLQSAQGASDQASQQGLDIAGQAQDRALQAMLQSGSLAGNIRGQDFGEQSQVAQARDAIAKFNAQNRNSLNQFNAGQANNMTQFNTGNQLQTAMGNRQYGTDVAKFNAGLAQDAKTANMQGRQGAANKTVDAQNQAASVNNQLPQQNFQNQNTIAAGKAGAAGQGQAYYQNQAKQKKDAWGNVIGGAATVGAAFI